jgi:hypothetical protein
MKVVWLCNFANQEIKEHFKTPQLNEFAPWINILIELFQSRKDFDLHITNCIHKITPVIIDLLKTSKYNIKENIII